MIPAARARVIPPSPIRRLAAGAPADAIPLGLGEPGWPLPPPARAALRESPAHCPYGPNAGLGPLRALLAERHRVPLSGVLVTAGGQAALAALFLSRLNPGDSVLTPDPGYPAYPALARLAGARPVSYPLGPDGALDPDALEVVLRRTPRTRLVVLNSPGNPTGGTAGADALAAVATAAAGRGVPVVSDEVYGELYLGRRPASLLTVAPTGSVVIGSLSKAGAAPGLRVGWLAGDPDLVQPALAVHALLTTTAGRPGQLAAQAVLASGRGYAAPARRALTRRWAALSAAWATHIGPPPPPPAGGFYLWRPLPPEAGEDDDAFCRTARDRAGVLLVPGGVFGAGGRGRFRLSFAAPPAVVTDGVRRLAPLLRPSGGGH